MMAKKKKANPIDLINLVTALLQLIIVIIELAILILTAWR